jgi:hypothetical protein
VKIYVRSCAARASDRFSQAHKWRNRTYALGGLAGYLYSEAATLDVAYLRRTPGHYSTSRMLTAGRNQIGLTERQIEYCLEAWAVLCADNPLELDTSEARQHSSRTRFNEEQNKVFLGLTRFQEKEYTRLPAMSTLACLAHELAHAERFQLGYRRSTDLPDVLLDEAETSPRASFTSVLRMKDREDLVEDARDRLIQWLAVRQQQGGTNEKS